MLSPSPVIGAVAAIRKEPPEQETVSEPGVTRTEYPPALPVTSERPPTETVTPPIPSRRSYRRFWFASS